MKINKHIGEEFSVLHGAIAKIIEYYDYKHVLVEFQDEYKARKITSINNLKMGKVLNPYSPTICGVGIVGEEDIHGENEALYFRWKAMIDRCYNENNKSYSNYGGKGVTVCSDWLLFANYKNDIKSMHNYDKIKEGWHIDKDIKGGTVYCKENCVICSPGENSIKASETLKKSNESGVIGVHKSGRKWRAQIVVNGVRDYKDFETIEEAIAYQKHRKGYE